MSGVLFLAVMTLVAVTDAFMGWRVLRSADQTVGAAPQPGATPPEAARKVGKMMLIAAAAMFLFGLSVSFGITPLDGITPIQIVSE